MAVSLILLCHGATASMRVGAFPTPDEDLDAGGRKAAALPAPWPKAATWLTSPARAARRTAELLGVAAGVDEVLRDLDYGAWAGRRFTDLQGEDPAALAAWMADPSQAAPGGEGLEEVRLRLESWLAAQAQSASRVVAVTHPMTIRAALSAALGMPVQASLRIDVAPLAAATLSFNGVWRLNAIQPPGRKAG